MSPAPFLCFLIATQLYAGIVAISNTTLNSTQTTQSLVDYLNATTPSPIFDFEGEIAKINVSFLACQDYEQLSRDLFPDFLAGLFNNILIKSSHRAIGFQELRSVLGFSLPDLWTTEFRPSREDIAAAPSVETYYELSELRKRGSTFISDWFFESQLLSGIEFLNRHLPVVRTIYRKKLEEIRRPTDLIVDREEIDYMFEVHSELSWRIDDRIRRILRCNNYKHAEKRRKTEKIPGF
ncbi:hypothetical protein GCK72_008475 [Caenorhabditis remanei]|uniref:Uncharacterized protein n=1 Tax=Caenorhabditis remanei TaxID=31234 RepID=A0A6A5GZV9_CAERE|nr:hypothetical protein GCK72_008475 [Caenorhabditis remanei]KAF1760229.1 hypothetical protein GCK72_008475 [Caenorhabditis remanei]